MEKKGPAKLLSTHYQQFAERIIEQIKKGVAPWQKPWKPGQRVLPQSLSTGREYRGGNILHLVSVAQEKGYSDPRWGTFEQIKSAGGYVRKGERGARVVWWDYSRTKEKVPVTDRQGNPVLDDKGEPIQRYSAPRMKAYTVFNVEQTENLKLKSLEEKPAWKAHQDNDALIKASGVGTRHVSGDRAYYNPSADNITLPRRSQFPSAEAYYQTANHELAHATGHPARMNRETLQNGVRDGLGSEAYAREELRAEISAMMTNTRLGVGHNSKEGSAYVASWSKILKEDPREIHFAARDAQKISDYLIEPIRDRLEERGQKPKEEGSQEPKQEQPRTQPPNLNQRIQAYRAAIPKNHVELEVKRDSGLPDGHITYKFRGQDLPSTLEGLTKKHFGKKQFDGHDYIVAHAPVTKVVGHLRAVDRAVSHRNLMKSLSQAARMPSGPNR